MFENEKERKKEAFLLTEKESARIFQREIIPYLFAEVSRSLSPRVIFVGAQPGAGKTALLRHLIYERSTQDNNIVEVVGDDLRAFHPRYDSLLVEDDELAAYYTDLDSARWIEMAINHAAREIGCSVGIEGTLRRHEVVSKTSSLFRENGYEIELNILLAHSLLSRLGIIERYLAQIEDSGTGRFSLREAHDVAYNALPNTVEQLILGHDVDEIRLFSRGGINLGVWTFGKDKEETIQDKDEVKAVILANRERMSLEAIDYLEETLPNIFLAVQKLGKQYLLKEVDNIQRDFFALRYK